MNISVLFIMLNLSTNFPQKIMRLVEKYLNKKWENMGELKKEV